MGSQAFALAQQCPRACSVRPLVPPSQLHCLSRKIFHLQAHRRRHGRDTCKTQAIGFELPGSETPKGMDRQAQEMSRAAASLLVFRAVLKRPLAKSYLLLLQAVAGRAPAERLLDAYGEFYAGLLAAGHNSWQEFLLDEILMARDNVFARAVADCNVKDNTPVREAAAYDLDVLQRLAVVEQTLVDWVRDTIGTSLSPAWAPAAASVGPLRAGALSVPLRRSPPPFRDDDDDPDEQSSPGRAPLTAEERRGWAERVAGCWRWSEALPELERYWRIHGWGLTSRHSALLWRDGSIEAAPDNFKGSAQSPTSGAAEESEGGRGWQLVKDAVEGLMANPAAIRSKRYLLVRGSISDSADGDSAVAGGALADRLIKEYGEQGLRVVSAGNAPLHGLGRKLSQHPRTCFAVVAVVGTSASTADLRHLMGSPPGTPVSGWPPNALLVAIEEEEVDGLFGPFVQTVLLGRSFEDVEVPW